MSDITDAWGHTAQEYGELFASLDDDFAGDGNSLVGGELGKRVRESLVNHSLMYGDVDSFAGAFVFGQALASGVLCWAVLEGYIDFTPKAMKSTEAELVEAD